MSSRPFVVAFVLGSSALMPAVAAPSGQTWKLSPDDGDVDDQFGTSVGVSVATALVGAPNDDDNGRNSGSV